MSKHDAYSAIKKCGKEENSCRKDQDVNAGKAIDPIANGKSGEEKALKESGTPPRSNLKRT